MCPKDPHELMEYADEFVPILIGRLSLPYASCEDRCEVKETLKRLMGRVLNIDRERDSEMDHSIQEFKGYVDREISRDQILRAFLVSPDPLLSIEYSLLGDIEDRILSLIKEINDSGLGLGQRSLNKNLIESALSEMKQIKSASVPLFRAKIEEIDVIATKALQEVDVKATPERNEAPSEIRDLSPSLDFWQDEHSLFHLDKLFNESTQFH